MAEFIVELIRSRGFEPVVGYYAFRSEKAELSVSLSNLGRFYSGPKKRSVASFGGVESYELGAWFPELEYTHYCPHRHWKEIIDTCGYHVSVSGACHAALPFVLSNRKCLAWVATDFKGDRVARMSAFPWYLRLFKRIISMRKMLRYEKLVLENSRVLALSRYTAGELTKISPNSPINVVLPMPIDTKLFEPLYGVKSSNRVGFIGRFDDDRKNVGLLLRAFRLCLVDNPSVKLCLIGGELTKKLQVIVNELGISSRLEVLPYHARTEMPSLLQRFDVFVIPSLQEGLCIAGLEAMSCGCPIVSTRCGGPEDFVIHAENGLLCDSTPLSMSKAICSIINNRVDRDRMALKSREKATTEYSVESASSIFWSEFETYFGTFA